MEVAALGAKECGPITEIGTGNEFEITAAHL